MASAGGIGFRDLGNTAITNSTALVWAMHNAEHYNVTYPVWQPDHFVGNASFWWLLDQHATVSVILGERLVENTGVTIQGGRVKALTTAGPDGTGSDPRSFSARYFVDASYEGDVMRFAGVTHTWGREARGQYNESLAGVTDDSTNHFPRPVSVLWPNGSLVDWVQQGPDPKSVVGQADDNVMAYSFRLCLTKRTDNRVDVTAPPGYSTERFELGRRYLKSLAEAQESPKAPWGNLPYRSYPPGDKLDACCGNSPMGIDAAGLAVGYSNGSYASRQSIKEQHRFYVQGLAFFWMYDPDSGVPTEMQQELRKYGLCKDEWPENGHWPPQLYVREAARLVGDAVFTQNDRIESSIPGGCKRDSIGTGSWGFDIHQMQRAAVPGSGRDAVALNEGLTSPGTDGNPVYEVPYSILLPKRADATNLLVPNCPSISHVAFSALREEPTLVKLGEAAGTAAAIAAGQPGAIALQDVSIEALQAGIRALGAYVHYPPRDNCSAPEPGSCSAYSVAGAGTAPCNGLYKKTGEATWTLDSSHQIYKYGDSWHIADNGHTIFYDAPDAFGVPLSGWKTADGAAPAPSLKCERQ